MRKDSICERSWVFWKHSSENWICPHCGVECLYFCNSYWKQQASFLLQVWYGSGICVKCSTTSINFEAQSHPCSTPNVFLSVILTVVSGSTNRD
jgi:hypothetical protein